MSAEIAKSAGSILCDELTKVYGDGTKAVDELSIAVDAGHVLALVGPSGCGKTTLLRMIAGLEQISGGRLLIDGRVVNRLPPRERDIAMIFQNYALYPHMTVYDNIAFGLRVRRTPKAIIRSRVTHVAELLGLTPWLTRRPAQLSGGQRQRVAMGRAIVREPGIFLMDEPLSNLDAQLRVRMRGEIARLQRSLGVTTVYVTHDQTEAMVLGDRVAVLKAGVLQQHGTADDVYERPENVFVARFLGTPGMNLLEATVDADADATVVQIGECQLRFAHEGRSPALPMGQRGPRTVLCGIRPEALQEPATRSGLPTLSGVVELREELGSDVHAHVRVGSGRGVSGGYLDSAPDVESSVVDAAGLVVARLSGRSRTREGERIDLAVDRSGVHFFEPTTEKRLRIW